MTYLHLKINTQRGGATILVALLLLIGTTIISFIGARSSKLEIKISNNELRHKEAFEVAEYGLEQGIAYVQANRSLVTNKDDSNGWLNSVNLKWQECTTTDIPCGFEGSAIYDSNYLSYANIPNIVQPSDSPIKNVAVHLITKKASGSNDPEGLPAITVIAVGSADSGKAIAVVKRTIKARSTFVNMGLGPLIVNGSPSLSSKTNIWGNPIGIGSAGPLAIWAKDEVLPMKNGSKTLDVTNPANYFPNDKNALSQKSLNGGDIIENDTNFPSDLFNYLFGVPKSYSADIQSLASTHADCDSLDSNSHGLIWIDGKCAFTNSNGSSISNSVAPLMLIVDGDFKVSDELDFWGQILITDKMKKIDIKKQLNIYGALLVDTDADFKNSKVNIIYDSTTLDNLNTQLQNYLIVNGSWFDKLN